MKKVVIGDHEDVTEVFNKMLKMDNIDMNVAYPKYLKIKGLVLSIADVFSALSNLPLIIKHPKLQGERVDLLRFIEATRTEVAQVFNLYYEGFEWNPDIITEEQKTIFASKWETIKTSNLINQFVVCCGGLNPYKIYIEDADKLSGDFIKRLPGVSWRPFPFVSLDYLMIYNLPEVGAMTMGALVAILHKIWGFTREIYRIVSSPDINVDEFATVIIENLVKIESLPALSRCKQAFKKIREALDMLKGNFGEYYQEFVTSRDSSTIMQSFLLDVQNSTKATPELTRQFNVIISYYRENVAKGNNTDPRLKSTMDKLQEKLDHITRGADNLPTRKSESPASGQPAPTAVPIVVDPSAYITAIPLQPTKTSPQWPTKK